MIFALIEATDPEIPNTIDGNYDFFLRALSLFTISSFFDDSILLYSKNLNIYYLIISSLSFLFFLFPTQTDCALSPMTIVSELANHCFSLFLKHPKT
jgi:hypothetical protein